ncbi:MAG: AMP-binding protein [Gammaproteobacteria bacterium]|nr:AMP-binding protein [Gammaproteobacteria bacterium]
MAVSDFLERGALVSPDGPCMIMGTVAHSYRDVLAICNRVAHTLGAAGLTPGRHAAVLCDNDPVGFAVSFGIMRAGLAYVPMDFRNSLEDNARILDFGEAAALFFQARFAGQVRALCARLPRLTLLVCLDERLADFPSLNDWCGAASAAAPPVEIALESTAWLQTGSGTSGDFRMAMITHRGYHAFVSFALHWLPDPEPVMLVAAPITHAGGGLAYHVLALGGKLVLLEKPDAGDILRAIEEHRVTKLFLPPTLIYRLIAHPELRRRDLSSLKYLAWSAAPMPVAKVREAVEALGPVLAQGYGQTEALGIACMSPGEFLVDGRIAPEERLTACGRPSLPFCRVGILDDQGVPVPTGERGEICVRGDQVMAGYYKNPAATAATIVDGWLHTGDVGYFDAEGYLHIVDRKKDLIISGGFNVYPAEIEAVVAGHPAVYECAVIGVPHEEWGEAVKAVVVLRTGAQATAAEIIEWCRSRLGGVKTPKSVDLIADLPRSARGKVLRRVLREPYWAGQARKV